MSGLCASRWAPAPASASASASASSSSSASGSAVHVSRKPTPTPTPTPSVVPSRVSSSRPTNGIIWTTGVNHGTGKTGITTTSAPVYADISTSTTPTPTPAITTSRPSPSTNASQELSRFTKIVARLKWKLPFLEDGYRLATQQPSDDCAGRDRTRNRDKDGDTETDTDMHYAETMFKIDFHEYYALLERAIVHLLGVFGVHVSSTPGRKWRGKKMGQSVQWNSTMRPAGGVGGGGAGHSYHANVLETLEDPACPLYQVLGVGSVHYQLRKAKELRNRWKTADRTEEEEEQEEGARRRPVLPLESYDFDQILTEIFGGLEEGYLLAQAYVEEVDGGANGREMEMEMDGGWDFIVEAMDWEAV